MGIRVEEENLTMLYALTIGKVLSKIQTKQRKWGIKEICRLPYQEKPEVKGYHVNVTHWVTEV